MTKKTVTPKTYKINLITNYTDGDSEDSLYEFTPGDPSKNPNNNDVVGLFCDAVKAAVKDWFENDPDEVESTVYHYGCLAGDRDEYDTQYDYIDGNFGSRCIPFIPENILASHGIKEITNDFIDAEFDDDAPFL